MRWIYLSPHLDDAVLSCGGLIREQTTSRKAVEIWTICAGDPPEGELSQYANRLHEEWGTGAETPELRRKEDISACLKLGARHRHLSFPDCIYRQDKDGNWLYPDDESIQSVLSPHDEITLMTLQSFLTTLLKPEDVLICPLSVGNHVDHQLTRKASESLGRPILYYQDVPYLFNFPEQLAEFSRSMQLQVFPFSLQALETWQETIRLYSSQFDSLFVDLKSMQESINRYYNVHQGMNLWKQS